MGGDADGLVDDDNVLVVVEDRHVGDRGRLTLRFWNGDLDDVHGPESIGLAGRNPVDEDVSLPRQLRATRARPVAVGNEVGDVADAESRLGSQSINQVSDGPTRQQRDRQQRRSTVHATSHHDQHTDDDDGEDRQNPCLASAEGEGGTRIVHERQRQPLPDERARRLAVKGSARPHL